MILVQQTHWINCSTSLETPDLNLKMVQITAMALTPESCALPKLCHATLAVWVCFSDVKMEPEKLLFGGGSGGGVEERGPCCAPCPPKATDTVKRTTSRVWLEDPVRCQVCSAALASQDLDHAPLRPATPTSGPQTNQDIKPAHQNTASRQRKRFLLLCKMLPASSAYTLYINVYVHKPNPGQYQAFCRASGIIPCFFFLKPLTPEGKASLDWLTVDWVPR